MATGTTQIDSLFEQLRASLWQAAQIFSSHTTGQLQHHPGRGCWSAAECIAHLNLSNRAYLSLLDSAIEELRKKKLSSDGPFRLNWNARLLKYWLEPPSRLRLPTGAGFQPAAVKDADAALGEFQAIGKELEEKLNSARGLALDQIKIISPFAENMKYNAYSAFVLIAAHNRRHLWQAEQALRS
ncbi:MAG TPA: DinB family protein [Candidatus Acidoferrum sp.]|nr:DinB family protein [Candidatus Acidoferrum sp.]